MVQDAGLFTELGNSNMRKNMFHPGPPDSVPNPMPEPVKPEDGGWGPLSNPGADNRSANATKILTAKFGPAGGTVDNHLPTGARKRAYHTTWKF
jgi:hypothetical protein